MNAVVPVSVNLPAHIAKRMNEGTSLTQNIQGGMFSDSHPRISIKGSTFRIKEGKDEEVIDGRKLPVIIVGANPGLSKIFYQGKWSANKDDASAPDCFSMDGIRPDPSSPHVQSPICATCPQNQWGSKTNDEGAKLKACADQKRLAVVSASDPGGTIYLLQVTPAALRNLNDYVKRLSRGGYPPELCITELGFDTDASFPKLTFEFKGFVPEDYVPIIDDLYGSERVTDITGEKPQVATIVQAEPAKPLLVREAKVVEVEHVEVEVVEPVKAEPAKPAKKSKFGMPGETIEAQVAEQLGVNQGVTQAPATSTKRTEPKAVAPSKNISEDIAKLLADED